jgi:PAS domain-containing protein
VPWRRISGAIKAAKPQLRNLPKPVVGLEHVYARQLTKELLSRNRHLETVLESMAEGILEVYSGKIVYANSAVITILGIPIEKLLVAYPPDLFNGIIREKIESIFASDPTQPYEIGADEALEWKGRQILLKKLPVKGDEAT